MKILMTLESDFPPDTRVENEIQALQFNGHELHIICRGSKGQPKEEKFNGCYIHRVYQSKLIYYSSVVSLRFPLYFNFWKRKISDLLKNYHFDVVHIHDLPLIKPISELGIIYPFRIVLDLHENWPELLKMSLHTKTLPGRILCSIKQWKEYERKYIGKADRIIVVIEEAKKRIAEISLKPDKIYVVSNTLNLADIKDKIHSESRYGQKTVLIYEGGITFHRGLQIVIEAIKLLKGQLSNFEFWIIGSGSYYYTLKKKALEAGVNEFIRFYGSVSQREVYELLARADFAVIPHLKSPHTDSTIPHKLFHYMYAGLPVISSNCIPLERIINETGCGVTYPYDQPESLSRIISQIMEEKDAFKSKYSNAIHWITNKYNWENDSRNLLSLYKSLV